MPFQISRRTVLRTLAVAPAAALHSVPPPPRPIDAQITRALRCIERSDMPPPRAAYALALFSRGMLLAVLAADPAQDLDSALEAAAAVLLPALFPLARGLVAFPPVVPGAAPAAVVQLLAAAAPPARPAFEAPVVDQPEAGIWAPTPHKYMSGLLPAWGTMPTWSALAEVAPPPPWHSAAFAATRTAFAATQRALSTAQRASAAHWEYGAGTVTPVGAWFPVALALAARAELAPGATAEICARLGTALHDSMVACWRAKYQYRVARPVQWFPAQEPGWWSAVETPPHPSYPSGHAVVSAAAAAVLGAAFPAEAPRLAQLARAAADSRVFGGIHWSIDATAGLELGRTVGQRVLALPTVAA